MFGAAVGMADRERTEALAGLRLRNSGEALLLLSAAGASRPPRSYALTAEGKSALFAGAFEAAAQVRAEGTIGAIAEPALVRDLLRCAPALRFAQLALRELSRAAAEALPALQEALADANALVLAESTAEILPDPRCRELWPQFVATDWLSTVAEAEGDRVEDDRQRSVLLQLWWFTGKGTAVERHASGRRYLAVPDGAKFRAAAQELLALLKELQASGDAARWRELLERHASRPDPRWREEIASRLQGVPRRVSVLSPRLEAVLDGAGKVVDAQAVAVQDFDIAGGTIPKGHQVVLMYGAANRDPAHFTDPERFDVLCSYLWAGASADEAAAALGEPSAVKVRRAAYRLREILEEEAGLLPREPRDDHHA